MMNGDGAATDSNVDVDSVRAAKRPRLSPPTGDSEHADAADDGVNGALAGLLNSFDSLSTLRPLPSLDLRPSHITILLRGGCALLSHVETNKTMLFLGQMHWL